MVESESQPKPPDVSDSRHRIATAMVDLVLERGYQATTLEALCERASVSTATFEAHFADLQDCLLQTYTAINELFDERVQTAYSTQRSWREALRAAAYAAAEFLDEHPRQVRFNTIAVLSAGEMLAAHRDVYLRQLVDLIDAGRLELDDPDSLGRGVAESVIGAIYERLLREVNRGGDALGAREVVPELMYIAVRPYLGHEEAVKELAIPPPPRRAGTGGREGRKT